MRYMLIATAKDLQDICQAAKAAGSVALDTEFVWERTYHPQLGLVQIALPDDRVFLVDTVALPRLDGLDEVLADPDTELLLHDALQDLQILARHTGAKPRNVFDTRRAAGFTGRPASLSLGNLLRDALGIDLAKDATRTNWLQRPLSASQISYACDDVLHLHALAEKLRSDAAALGHEAALREEMERFDDAAQYDTTSADTLYLRFRTTRLAPETCKAVYALLIWREEEAIAQNRPRGHIIKDAMLLDIASKSTATPPLQTDIPRRHAAAIHKTLREAQDLSPEDLPATLTPVRMTSALKKDIETRRERVQQRATEAKIDPALVANKAEITALVLHEHGMANDYPEHLTSGWRQAFTAPTKNAPKSRELAFDFNL